MPESCIVKKRPEPEADSSLSASSESGLFTFLFVLCYVEEIFLGACERLLEYVFVKLYTFQQSLSLNGERSCFGMFVLLVIQGNRFSTLKVMQQRKLLLV